MLHSAPSHAVLKKVKTASHYNVPWQAQLIEIWNVCENSSPSTYTHLHTFTKTDSISPQYSWAGSACLPLQRYL